ncbi:MAG: anthranilate synthase component I family protein [Psychroflexus sp.]|nr:anthranilate synthase component I family protein [Psychroflexus sp.]MDN6310166.1 anthranilate synthase component I family protein [Psychroflexus sp.]
MRKQIIRRVSNPAQFIEKLFHWASQQTIFTILEGQQMEMPGHQFDCVIGIGKRSSLNFENRVDFDQVDHYHQQTKDWLFSYISYDVKNSIENLTSDNSDGLHFPHLTLIQPQKVLCLKNDMLFFHYLDQDVDSIADDLNAILLQIVSETPLPQFEFQSRMPRKMYLENASHLMQHIQRGDIYEINFCQEYYAENVTFNCLQAYKRLRELSKAPFSVFAKHDSHYIISASPERYLSKTETDLISQPIKGTAKRDSDLEKDEALKIMLQNDPKERAENIMIVDLVRNDLSKIAQKSSVCVDELCEIYSFEQVHQMISTLRCSVDKNIHLSDILKASFPMGSMTGAPKYKTMQLAEKYENTKRGLYSGSVGYITPEFNFDFNVIIRSLLYNADTRYLSYMVGSALTAQSDIEKEYEECELKGKAMKQIFGQS